MSKLKKLVFILTILCIVLGSILVYGLYINKENDNTPIILETYTDKVLEKIIKSQEERENGTLTLEFVTDKNTAIKIAQTIFESKIGTKWAKSYAPYNAIFYKKFNAWLIYSNFHIPWYKKFFKLVKLGGEPYMLIQKTDGKVLAYWITY